MIVNIYDKANNNDGICRNLCNMRNRTLLKTHPFNVVVSSRVFSSPAL